MSFREIVIAAAALCLVLLGAGGGTWFWLDYSSAKRKLLTVCACLTFQAGSRLQIKMEVGVRST